MSNSDRAQSAPLHAARLPFGDESSPAENTTRFPGILEGAEKQLAEAVVNMVLVGGGISFAGTADGGAISVTVFYGRERQKKYAASPEAFQALLEAVGRWTPAQPVELRSRAAAAGDRRR